MDRIDKKILALLQMDSQISNQELADKVALSPSPCLRRVKQLEEEGYIRKYVALLNPEKLELQLTIFVLISLNSHDTQKMAGFENAIKSSPEVIECHLITGHTADYLLKVIVCDLKEYQSFLLDKLTKIEGVSHVHSSFVLQSTVNKTELPLSHLK